MAKLKPSMFGYSSWEALWMNYTVAATIRNPFDRAGSALDFLAAKRKVCLSTMLCLRASGA